MFAANKQLRLSGSLGFWTLSIIRRSKECAFKTLEDGQSKNPNNCSVLYTTL
jgi:hypothetical protein